MLDKVIDFIDRAINFIVVVFCLLLMLIGGYAIYDSYKIYDNTALDDEVIGLKPKENNEFDIDALKKINPDIEGWIRMFETTIDYPIVHSRNNLEYLNEKYDGGYSTGGSIFTDYRNAKDFADDYTIIYGHNMTTGQMFSDVKKYEQADYFGQHLYGVLHTKGEVYKVEAMYLAKVNAFSDDIYNLITYANDRNSELANLVKNKAKQINYIEGVDKLILLSTCDSYGSNDRTVLLAKLTDSDRDEVTAIAEMVKEQVAVSGGAEQGWDFEKMRQIGRFAVVIVVIVLVGLGVRKYIKYRTHRREQKK